MCLQALGNNSPHEPGHAALLDAGLEGKEVRVDEVLLGNLGVVVVAGVGHAALRRVLHLRMAK